MRSNLLRYYITDRRAAGGASALLGHIARLGDSIDLLQVREKDLEALELAALVRSVLRTAHPKVRVLVNERADVAICCAAHGVHLRGQAFAASTIRPILPPDFLISVSCHSVEDVARASGERADYALLSPIFPSPGKGLALGLDTLRQAARVSRIPVLALGGLNCDSVAACAAAGAGGIAGIRYFQESCGSSGLG